LLIRFFVLAVIVINIFLYLIIGIEIKHKMTKINNMRELSTATTVLLILVDGFKMLILYKNSFELFDNIHNWIFHTFLTVS